MATMKSCPLDRLGMEWEVRLQNLHSGLPLKQAWGRVGEAGRAKGSTVDILLGLKLLE